MLRVAPINDAGELDLDGVRAAAHRADEAGRGGARLQRPGHHQPGAARSSTLAHARGVPVLVDGAQAVPHLPVDVQELDCDFYAFSGHKVFGPTGIGVLYGKAELLEAMPPWQGGGDMIRSVTLREDHLQRAAVQVRGRHAEHRRRHRPRRGARLPGPASAWTAIAAHEHELLAYATRALSAVAGRAPHRHRAARRPSVLSFVIDGVHPHDIGTILDRRGHRHPRRPPLRAAAHGALRRAGHGARLVRASTTRATRSTRWCAGCRGCGRCSPDVRACGELYQERHPRPQSVARATSASWTTPTGQAEGYNPLCGDQLTVWRQAGRRRHRATSAFREPAAPSPRPRRR